MHDLETAMTPRPIAAATTTRAHHPASRTAAPGKLANDARRLCHWPPCVIKIRGTSMIMSFRRGALVITEATRAVMTEPNHVMGADDAREGH